MEAFIPHIEQADRFVSGVDLRTSPPTLGQAVILLDKPRAHQAAIDTQSLIVPVTFGRATHVNDARIGLQTPFAAQPSGFDIDDYMAATGSALEQIASISYTYATSDNPYLRANAVMFAGLSKQLDLAAPPDSIAHDSLQWLQNHEHELAYSEVEALLYAYITPGNEKIVQDVLRRRLQSSASLSDELRYGSLLQVYVDITAGPDVTAAAQLASLEALLKTGAE